MKTRQSNSFYLRPEDVTRMEVIRAHITAQTPWHTVTATDVIRLALLRLAEQIDPTTAAKPATI